MVQIFKFEFPSIHPTLLTNHRYREHPFHVWILGEPSCCMGHTARHECGYH